MKRPAAKIILLALIGIPVAATALATGIWIGSEPKTQMVVQKLASATKPVLTLPKESERAPIVAPVSYEDGPGEGFDSNQIPAGIVFDLRDESQGRYVNSDINVINQTGRIVKEGDASIRLEFDPCLKLDRVVFRPWALSWMMKESDPGFFKPDIFPKAIDKIFGDGFDIPRMMPDGNQICYVSFRVKEGTPSLDRDPIFVTLYAKGEGQSGWTQVDREKVWF